MEKIKKINVNGVEYPVGLSEDEVLLRLKVTSENDITDVMYEVAQMYFNGEIKSGYHYQAGDFHTKVQFVGAGVLIYLYDYGSGAGISVHHSDRPINQSTTKEQIDFSTTLYQPRLYAGEGITINENNVISASGGSGGSKYKLYTTGTIDGTFPNIFLEKDLEPNKLYLIELDYYYEYHDDYGDSHIEPRKISTILKTGKRYTEEGEDGNYEVIENSSTPVYLEYGYDLENYTRLFAHTRVEFVLGNEELWGTPNLLYFSSNDIEDVDILSYVDGVSCKVYEIGGFENE